jgi:hypothetical protein
MYRQSWTHRESVLFEDKTGSLVFIVTLPTHQFILNYSSLLVFLGRGVSYEPGK